MVPRLVEELQLIEVGFRSLELMVLETNAHITRLELVVIHSPSLSPQSPLVWNILEHDLHVEPG